MKVVLTDEALADLAVIGDHIAIDNPGLALTFVRELRQAARQLGDMPFAFPIVPRYERAGLRRRVHGSYLIFYAVEPTRVTVIHILHGARDLARILAPFE